MTPHFWGIQPAAARGVMMDLLSLIFTCKSSLKPISFSYLMTKQLLEVEVRKA